MKGWMGGKRRHIAVRRRDPNARQREIFARRRQLARQSLPRGQKTGAQMNMENGPGRPPRPPASHIPRTPQAPQNALRSGTRRDPKQPFQYSKDIVMFGDASGLESIVPEYRHARKRFRDRAAREERESKRRREAKIEEPVDAFSSSYPSQDIRIFDADDEKTPLFRRRTLPHNFLNSEDTTRHRTSKHFAKETVPLPKRHKVSTTPDLINRFSGLQFSPLRRIEGFRRVVKESSNTRGEVTKPFLRHERNPPLPESPSDKFDEIRTGFVDDGRSLRVPQERFERPEVVSGLVPDGIDNLTRRRISESPERVKTSPLRWKDIDLESRSQSPVLPAKHVDAFHSIENTRLESRFPLIEAESESPPLLSPDKKEQESPVIGFRSLLAYEPITPDYFSAEVHVLEAKMFERPDSDGRRFRVRRKLQRRDPCEEVGHGSTRERDLRTNAGIKGGNSESEVNREMLSSTKDVKDVRLEVRTGEGKICTNDSIVAEPEKSNHGIVDVTLIRTEQNPVHAARSKRLADDHKQASKTV